MLKYICGDIMNLLFTKLNKRVNVKEFYEIVDIEMNSGFIPYTESMILECIKYMDNFIVKDIDKDLIVGFITIEENDYLYNNSNYIVNISVLPEYRRNGLAKGLILFACKYYQNMNSENIQLTLDVNLDNKAIELYKKIGFEKLEMLSRNGKTDIVMGADINKLIFNISKLVDFKMDI